VPSCGNVDVMYQEACQPPCSFRDGLDKTSATRAASGSSPPVPSAASRRRDIVLSMLLRRVEGLVIVVPKLCVRMWPRWNGDPGDMGEPGDIGDS